MHTDDEKSLEYLRQILLDNDHQKLIEFESELDKINYQLSDKEAKINVFLPIITDLLERKIIDSEDELVKVFSPIMGSAIKKQVSDSKEDIIEALYPIMGDAIKRSVAESIKEIYTSINMKIEKALRRGIFSRQIKSKISGVSGSDLILQQSFPFCISEIFLIHESSGLLITHVSSSESEMSSDGDLISGMLTAIKDFVAESFKKNGGSQNLYEIQYGDSKIVLERGLYSYIAVVISGQEPIHFHTELSELNSDLYKNNHEILRKYNGESVDKKKIEKLFIDFIERYKSESIIHEEYKPTPMLLYLFLTTIVILAVIFGIITIPQYLEDKSNEEIIENKLQLINELNIDELKWASSDGNVVLDGVINSFEVKKQIDSTIMSIPTVTNLKNNLYVGIKSSPPDSILSALKLKLNDYDTSNLTYQIIDDEIIIEGQLDSEDDKRKISHIISTIHGVRVVINNITLINENGPNITEIKDKIRKSELIFEYMNSSLNPEHKLKLNEIVSYVKDIKDAHLIITAISVGENNNANIAKANERSNNVYKFISSNGVSQDQIEIRNIILKDSNSTMNKYERFVQFELIIKE